MQEAKQSPRQVDLMLRLRRRMELENLSLEHIATTLDCHASTVSRMLRGITGIKARIEASVEDLLSIEEQSIDSMVATLRGMSPPERRIVLHFMQYVQGLQGGETEG